jgi:hypothetical protein
MEQIRTWEANSRWVSQQIPYLIWHPKVHSLVHKNAQRSRPCVTIQNIPVFYSEELLVVSPTTKLEDHPLYAVRDCLFNIFADTPHLHLWQTQNSPYCDDKRPTWRRNNVSEWGLNRGLRNQVAYSSPQTVALSIMAVYGKEGKISVMKTWVEIILKHLACQSRLTEPLRHTVYLEVAEGQLSSYISCCSGARLRRVCLQLGSLSLITISWLNHSLCDHI